VAAAAAAAAAGNKLGTWKSQLFVSDPLDILSTAILYGDIRIKKKRNVHRKSYI
jgi:hypothetical protein